MFENGTIICVKTTGERVCVIGFIPKPPHLSDRYMVRRPVMPEAGAITHEETEFAAYELESLVDHADRQVTEMIIKAKAQASLMKAELALNQEVEDAEIVSSPAALAKPPVN